MKFYNYPSLLADRLSRRAVTVSCWSASVTETRATVAPGRARRDIRPDEAASSSSPPRNTSFTVGAWSLTSSTCIATNHATPYSNDGLETHHWTHVVTVVLIFNLARYTRRGVYEISVRISIYWGPTDRPHIWENFKWPYLREGSSDPLDVWFYGGFFRGRRIEWHYFQFDQIE